MGGGAEGGGGGEGGGISLLEGERDVVDRGTRAREGEA
jgi:hypothetical protein